MNSVTKLERISNNAILGVRVFCDIIITVEAIKSGGHTSNA